jgi:UDPglucose--hexose-1-phosphate uridylyltransferase
MAPLNEFRQDLVSGEWVLLAAGRGKRPSTKVRQVLYQTKAECPFEDPWATEQEVIWAYPDQVNWKAAIIKNKFPTLRPGQCMPEEFNGPFKYHPAVGDHEVVIYRDHDKAFDDFSRDQIVDMIRVYKKRYKELAISSTCAKYISIFHNHGLEAGATVYHPHSQIITTPILPPDIFRSITGSYNYYKVHQKRVYDVILDWEVAEKKRIVYQNDRFIAFCPYVSKYPYEVRIFSKEGHAHFEQMPDDQDLLLADALYTVAQKMRIVLGRPSFNFFIHTAPLENEAVKSEFGMNMHEFYHWHMEFIPHVKLDAGFEMGTGIEINVIDPDEAADELRGAQI